MTVQTLALGKKKYVAVPKKDHRRPQAKAEEIITQKKADITAAKRGENGHACRPPCRRS
jgi:hypothetical protein